MNGSVTISPMMQMTVSKMSGDMRFVGIFYIIMGALYCLSIIGALVGIPLIICGLRLREAADSFTSYLGSNDSGILERAFERQGSFFFIQKVINIKLIRLLGRHAAGGCVGLKNVAFLLQRHQLISNRGRAHLFRAFARQKTGRERFGVFDEVFDELFEEFLLAFVHRGGGWCKVYRCWFGCWKMEIGNPLSILHFPYPLLRTTHYHLTKKISTRQEGVLMVYGEDIFTHKN